MPTGSSRGSSLSRWEHRQCGTTMPGKRRPLLLPVLDFWGSAELVEKLIDAVPNYGQTFLYVLQSFLHEVVLGQIQFPKWRLKGSQNLLALQKPLYINCWHRWSALHIQVSGIPFHYINWLNSWAGSPEGVLCLSVSCIDMGDLMWVFSRTSVKHSHCSAGVAPAHPKVGDAIGEACQRWYKSELSDFQD